MEVVLLERVEKLGLMGDVVKVKTGYARNYLLPQGKALRANKGNLALFETRRVELEARNLERRGEAEAVAGKMQNVSVVLVRQAGESGQLYGSVNARDIAAALTESGYQVERQQVILERPIKTLGIHELRVALHPEVSVPVSVNVARSAAEAERQAKGEPLEAEDFFQNPEDVEDADVAEENAAAEGFSEDDNANA